MCSAFLYSRSWPWFSKIIFFADEHNLQEEKRKWLHLHLAKIKVGVQLLVSPWKISNICSWSRTTPLIHSPCFSLPSISNSTRKRVWGKWNMNFDQLGYQWLDLWMLAHVVAQIKTVGAGMFLGVFFFVSWEPWLAFFFLSSSADDTKGRTVCCSWQFDTFFLRIRWIWFSLFHKYVKRPLIFIFFVFFFEQ